MTDTDGMPTSRRSVLKRTGALGAATVGLGAASAPASAGHTVQIGLAITQRWIENRDTPYEDATEVGDEIQSRWDVQIDNADDEYPATVFSTYEIEDRLTNGSLEQRLSDADAWLQSNESSRYDYFHSWIVLDYYGAQGTAGRMAEGYTATAGQDNGAVGIVDDYFFQNREELPDVYGVMTTPRMALRSILENYGARSEEHVTHISQPYVPDGYSLLYKKDVDAVECGTVRDDDSTTWVTSQCTRDTVRQYVEDNFKS